MFRTQYIKIHGRFANISRPFRHLQGYFRHVASLNYGKQIEMLPRRQTGANKVCIEYHIKRTDIAVWVQRKQIFTLRYVRYLP